MAELSLLSSVNLMWMREMSANRTELQVPERDTDNDGGSDWTTISSNIEIPDSAVTHWVSGLRVQGQTHGGNSSPSEGSWSSSGCMTNKDILSARQDVTSFPRCRRPNPPHHMLPVLDTYCIGKGELHFRRFSSAPPESFLPSRTCISPQRWHRPSSLCPPCFRPLLQ